MEHYTKEQELEMVKAVRRKGPAGALAIECEFYNRISEDFTISLGDVCTERVSNEHLIEESLEWIRSIADLAGKDFLNFQKCTAFVRENYPHALLSYCEFMIGVNNLSPEEAKHCLAQTEMRFVYYSENPEDGGKSTQAQRGPFHECL
jgi:hypothetical protein